METVPPEIIEVLFLYLCDDPKSALAFQLTCKTFFNITHTTAVFQKVATFQSRRKLRDCFLRIVRQAATITMCSDRLLCLLDQRKLDVPSYGHYLLSRLIMHHTMNPHPTPQEEQAMHNICIKLRKQGTNVYADHDFALRLAEQAKWPGLVRVLTIPINQLDKLTLLN